MSTRSTTHFLNRDGRAEAVIYRHYDGYPEGAGQDLLEFIASPASSRLGDIGYLAARYVCFLAKKFEGTWQNMLGVGVYEDDPADIEYRYLVLWDGTVECYRVECDWDTDEWTEEQVDLKAELALAQAA